MAPQQYRLIGLLKIIGVLAFILVLPKVFSWYFDHPGFSTFVVWGTILIGCTWFIWILISRWYPTLKEEFGLPRVYKVLGVLNALAWLPGFWIERNSW